MNDRYQPGPLPPRGGEDGDDSSLNQERRLFNELTAAKITTARNLYYAAAAEAVVALQNGRFLGSEQLFAAIYAQISRSWWDLVEAEVTHRRLTCDHAVRRVRSWARHFLTKEAPAARPGTLFDHALAHAARMAARDFLEASGQLLTQHLAETGDDAPVPGTPSGHATPPPPGVPSATANTP